jgi:hypothetical protein
VLSFNTAEVVGVEEKAPADGRCETDLIGFPAGGNAAKGWIDLQQLMHLPLEAAAEALPTAAQGCALRTDVLVDPIRERKEERDGLIVCAWSGHALLPCSVHLAVTTVDDDHTTRQADPLAILA